MQVTTLGYGVMDLRGLRTPATSRRHKRRPFLTPKPSTSRAHYEAEATLMVDHSHYGLAAYWTYDIGSRLRGALASQFASLG